MVPTITGITGDPLKDKDMAIIIDLDTTYSDDIKAGIHNFPTILFEKGAKGFTMTEEHYHNEADLLDGKDEFTKEDVNYKWSDFPSEIQDAMLAVFQSIEQFLITDNKTEYEGGTYVDLDDQIPFD